MASTSEDNFELITLSRGPLTYNRLVGFLWTVRFEVKSGKLGFYGHALREEDDPGSGCSFRCRVIVTSNGEVTPLKQVDRKKLPGRGLPRTYIDEFDLSDQIPSKTAESLLMRAEEARSKLPSLPVEPLEVELHLDVGDYVFYEGGLTVSIRALTGEGVEVHRSWSKQPIP